MDKTSDYTKNSYTETYGENDVYTYSGDPSGGNGTGKYTWDGDSKIKRSGVSGQSSMDLEIVKISRKDFQYKTTINGESAEFIFEEK